MKRRQEKKNKLPAEAFDAMPRVALVLTDETMYLTKFDGRGTPTVTYPVRATDVASAFHGFGASTGVLPDHCLFWQTRKGIERIAIVLPAAVRLLTWQGQREMKLIVPLPTFVFVGEGNRYFIYAAKDVPEKGNDQLYRAPLPNVHDSGEICAGNVKFPKCRADTIHTAAQLFFDSTFNSDLSNAKVRAQDSANDADDDEEDEIDENYAERFMRGEVDALEAAHGRTPRPRETMNLFQFLQSLEGKKGFPLDELIPDCTLNQILEAK